MCRSLTVLTREQVKSQRLWSNPLRAGIPGPSLHCRLNAVPEASWSTDVGTDCAMGPRRLTLHFSATAITFRQRFGDKHALV